MADRINGVGSVQQSTPLKAQAFAAEGGITLHDVPWTPRVGLEFTDASGDGNKANCNANTGAGCGGNSEHLRESLSNEPYFDGLCRSDGLAEHGRLRRQLADEAESRATSGFPILDLPQSQQQRLLVYRQPRLLLRSDCRNRCQYRDQQLAYKEIDGVYTLFFKDNKVAWQTGISYLIAGQMLDQLASGNAAGSGASAVNSIWAYNMQLHCEFSAPILHDSSFETRACIADRVQNS